MFAQKCLIFIFIFTTTAVAGFKNSGRYKAVSENMILPENLADSIFNEKTMDKTATDNIIENVTNTHNHKHANENEKIGQIPELASNETGIKFAPKFKHPSKMLNMTMRLAGRSIRLKCAADGNPIPNITWFKNEITPIVRPPKYSQPSYGKWSMSIRNLTVTDDGFYDCLVCNEVGCIEHSVMLVVGVSFESEPEPVTTYGVNQTKLLGETVHLKCQFPFDMYPHIIWERVIDDEYVDEDSFFKNSTVKSEDPTDVPGMLTIFNVTKEHEGWYLCLAFNMVGGKSLSASYLTVLDYIPVTAVPDHGRTGTFTCQESTSASQEETTAGKKRRKKLSIKSWTKPLIITLMVIIVVIALVLVKLKRDKQQVIQRTREIISEQWTKIVSIERALNNENNDGTHSLQMPVITIEKQKLIDVEKNNTYSVLPSQYVLPLDATWEISRHDVTLQKVLGVGEFGIVMKAECFGLPNSSTSETVAVKMLKDGHSDDDMIAFVSEMEIMKMVGKHKNIVNLLGCCTRDGAPYIIVEYAENGCLREYLRKHRPGYKNSSPELKQRDLVNFALQVANGMEFLVKRGCVHRDLAARNVLVSGARVLKVADFGLARDVRDSHYYRKRLPGKLPLRWMAPESICDNYYNNKSDVWSFGVLTWEIMTLGDTPYQHVPAHYLYHYLKLGQRVEKPTSCSEETYALIKHCCTFNLDGRPTFTEIKEKLQTVDMKILD